ncbi:MAG: PD40 domain-containing protein [Anaerolineae bacterium]|nr:PD40 domain-containing protein [Anaerolineae bacterium]
MRTLIRAVTATIAIALIGTSGTPASRAAQTSGVNLLTNPGFEDPYNTWNGVPELKLPYGWQPWWSEYPHDADWQNLRPEFDRAATYDGYGYRVHGGTFAVRYFKSFATFTAGVLQVVEGVTPGATLEFSVWGHSWSCSDWDLCQETLDDGSRRVRSAPPDANVVMKIGIDPTGGTDPFSSSVVWSPGVRALDSYRLFTVQAAAQSSRVTVFTYAWQEWAALNQDAYWDDASLVAVGGPPPAAETPAPTAGAAPAVDTAQPEAEQGVYTVQPGDTLSGIAYRYHMTLDELRALNGIAPGDNIIKAGEKLIVSAPEATRVLPGATPTPAAVADAPTPTPDSRNLLAFVSDWDGDWELFVADIAGNQVFQVTNNDADDQEPVWSPDGARLAFASDRAGDWNIYVLDLTCLESETACSEADAVQVTEDPAEDRQPAWTADGSQLVFQSNRDSNWKIYQVDPASGLVQLLITSSANSIAPVWQPKPLP